MTGTMPPNTPDMSTALADANSNSSRCPQCGAVVTCGAVSSTGKGVGEGGSGNAVQCWCLDWPTLPASARLGAGACLCPDCLRAALRAAGVVVDGTAADPAMPGG